MLMANKPVTGQDGLYASATYDQNSHEIILKLVNSRGEAKPVQVVLEGTKKLSGKAGITTLQSDDLGAFNSLEHPTALTPVEQDLILKGKRVNQSLKPYSLTVIKIKQE